MRRKFRSSAALFFASAAILAAAAAPATAQSSSSPVKRDPTLEIACGAQSTLQRPTPTVRILGGQERGKTLFTAGEAVILTGGTAQGLKAGQEYFVRRLVADRFVAPISDNQQPLSIHTAGWIKIVDVQQTSAIATVTHACDGMMEGDYLEPFAMPTLPAAGPPTGEPDYASAGRVILADERRQMGGPGSLMVVDRGTDHGLRAGQWMTIYRETRGPGGPIFRIGDAQVITVGSETSLVKVTAANDAVYVGDRIAINR